MQLCCHGALEAEGGVVNLTQKLSHDSRDILMKIGQSNDILHFDCDSLCIIVCSEKIMEVLTNQQTCLVIGNKLLVFLDNRYM